MCYPWLRGSIIYTTRLELLIFILRLLGTARILFPFRTKNLKVNKFFNYHKRLPSPKWKLYLLLLPSVHTFIFKMEESSVNIELKKLKRIKIQGEGHNGFKVCIGYITVTTPCQYYLHIHTYIYIFGSLIITLIIRIVKTIRHKKHIKYLSLEMILSMRVRHLLMYCTRNRSWIVSGMLFSSVSDFSLTRF